MSDTKEKIMYAALRLFARSGFGAVSVSEIAGELGISKGALYKHYKNKRDIFDCIVQRMYRIDAERAEKFNVPKESYSADSEAYAKTTAENIKEFALAQFKFWTEDPFASCFRKMLILEQYQDKETAELYNNCIVFGPVEYTADIFREMMKNGVMISADARTLALEYYAPMYLLINLSDHSDDKAEQIKLLKTHIDRFNKSNLISRSESK